MSFTRKSLTTLLIIAFVSFVKTSWSQCTWQTVFTDGYEYQTVVPHLIPGATIHNIPKNYAVHSGNYSLYMNMTNCVGGAGTCAGDTVYVRPMSVCPNLPVQISSYLTTSFSGPQCNVRLTVIDGNGVVLHNIDSVAAPYAPLWYQYSTGSITPTDSVITFILITNVPGGNGNDLSMDDFKLERCIVNASSSYTSQFACSNAGAISLFNSIPGTPDTTGTWSGPSILAGGFAGTFTPFVNSNGTYIYNSAPYGTSVGCPQFNDSVSITTVLPPAAGLGPDTTYCTGLSYVLDPGSNPANIFNWSDGSTGSSLAIFSATPATQTYWVTVTDLNGCVSTDSITVTFEICLGISESEVISFDVFPNPATSTINIISQTPVQKVNLINALGQVVLSTISESTSTLIDISILPNGLYLVECELKENKLLRRSLQISR